HEVVQGELASSLELVEQAHGSIPTFEPVVLGDLVHRLAPPLSRDPVAFSRVRLLGGQQLLTSTLPLQLGNDLGKVHRYLHRSGDSRTVDRPQLFAPGWYGGASPHPQRGTGARSTTSAPGCELCSARRLPHSAYAKSADRNSGSSGRSASSAARLMSD